MTYDLCNAEDGVESIWVVKKTPFARSMKKYLETKYIHERIIDEKIYRLTNIWK